MTALSSVTRTAPSILQTARQVLGQEIAALQQLQRQLDHRFEEAANMILASSGCLIVTGMGKAGLVGQKMVATFASLGTRSHFLHPAEAIHGDLGRIHEDDIVLCLSHSGETEEIVRLLPMISHFHVPLIAVTGRPNSYLAQNADVVLDLGHLREAGALALAPSSSTTAMLALGDALAIAVSELRGFTSQDFARFHPGGSLGRRLSKVEQLMRPLTACRLGSPKDTVRDVLTKVDRPGRRTGAVMLLGPAGRLAGIFTDSDFAKLFAQRNEQALDAPIAHVMTTQPITVREGTLLGDAIAILQGKRISELPVIRQDGTVCGLLDITDLVGDLPAAEGPPVPTEDPCVLPFPKLC